MESVLAFHLSVGSADPTQVVRFCDKCLYLMSHLAGP